ncbi:hypothetical protein [Pedobacter sp.]|uniref:hypothetical protein n=1 Tax=Pedobacter sp. TaxID=1411316 RepID=UPI003BAB9906
MANNESHGKKILKMNSARSFRQLYEWVRVYLSPFKTNKNPVSDKIHGELAYMENLIGDRKGRPTFYISYTGL